MADDQGDTWNQEIPGNQETPWNQETSGNRQAAADQQTSRHRWRLSRRAPVGVLISLVVFGLGLIIGLFVISSSGSSGGTGSPNDAIACSYFWQFEADPGNPMLVQEALSHNPGTDSGSHYLYEWLSTLYQQVGAQQTLANRQADSKDSTAVTIGSICQQEGY